MLAISLLLAVLGTIAAPSLAVPILNRSPLQALQHSIARPWRQGPAISQAPNSDKIGVRFRIPADPTSKDLWTTTEIFMPIGQKMRVAQHSFLPARPESFEIISIPNDGLHQRRECIVHPNYDDAAAYDSTGPGAWAPMVVIADEDGAVPLYRHSEGPMAEEQEALAYSCF
ncbi:hypothetical protein K461DRAFT_23323 [Myriangium duriaei CBS 260.36]|uniref:Uncharacterized protein n=1 Tax=Myriangium duriaei CBS 260.36 TaxID=1168546 RepID=A0A9P4JCS5_9PEZI|nr:hypothetical protein K461DRAFT_23323 [Myriangium duriaei CBS 260.36]